MSALEIRASPPEDFERFARTTSAAFSDEAPAAAIEHWRVLQEYDRSLGAYEAGALVGTAMSFPFTLTVPGGELPTAAVTAVGVLPTHRRRGILTALMRRQLGDAHGWGEPLAALWASEASIYGRYGYGIATQNGSIDADRDKTGFPSFGKTTVSGRLLAADEALELLPGVYDSARVSRIGFISRPREWWEHETLIDEEWARNGGGPQHRVVLETGGTPVAYAIYRVNVNWEHGVPQSTLVVEEAVATTDEAERELWGYIGGVDLIARVRARSLSPDHPLFLLVAEPTRLRFRLGDGLFVRLIDVAAALRGRSYAAEGRLTLELRDRVCPWNEGRIVLEAGSDGSTVRRLRRAPDLVLDVSILAAAYLGGFSFGDLARAGLLEEARKGAVARADALFATERAPWCASMF